jgi:hypothetical protein
LGKLDKGRGAQVHYFFRNSLERSELNDNGQVFHARATIHSVGLVAPICEFFEVLEWSFMHD